ncbi:MAG: ABC transporter permease, partial [Fibrella sp.]|nr:ABC transporter permease [Armatimonadota bacterium]
SGAAIASALIIGLGGLRQPAARPGGVGEPLFPSDLTWQLVAIAIASAVFTTVLAAALPARRAALLDPVEVLR